jgi:diaminopimelate epimerase
MADISFVKMSGSGNDFVVVDNRGRVIPESAFSSWTQQVCRRRVSIGADGCVFLEDASASSDVSADFRWRYFNADGSEGEMCGNGAMCGAHVAFLLGMAAENMTFSTKSGLVSASLQDDSGGSFVWLDLPDSGPIEPVKSVQWRGQQHAMTPVKVGVPHAVLAVDNADTFATSEEFDAFGRYVRHSSVFRPTGTNVNIVSRNENGSVRMRTYERGVEAETLACGTGAVATAVVAHSFGWDTMPLTIQTSSGALMHVDLNRTENRGTNIRLGGGAREVARGVVSPGALV